jgi:hypothetical protein
MIRLAREWAQSVFIFGLFLYGDSSLINFHAGRVVIPNRFVACKTLSRKWEWLLSRITV